MSDRKWEEAYPRPQLVREDWMSLDGEWTFGIKKESESGIPEKRGLINVPFCPESSLSGIRRRIAADEVMLYGKKFTLPPEWAGRKIILHFGAVDQVAKVYVDGRLAGTHEGGYLPFSFDISGLLTGGDTYDTDNASGEAKPHSVIVEVRDSLDHRYPWGKQKVKNGGMWYTPVSGIWQSVWIEPVADHHIKYLRIDTGADYAEVQAYGIRYGTLELGGKQYEMSPGASKEGPFAYVHIDIEEPRLWSPEDPYLYEFSIKSGSGDNGSVEGGCDCISSYFALRTLTIEQKDGFPRLCLNGEPYYFNGVLDQGYWHDGIYTPSSPDKYVEDILAMKLLGFNTLRKHIKIEPEVFYHECDRLGMVVFQDMVNNSDYSFPIDTVLPTIGIKRVSDKKMHKDPESRRIFTESMEQTVRLLYNHPSICYWTIFNEGWGQFDADAAYDKLSSLDDSRFIDSTSGWFWQNKSDVDSYHVYFRKAALEPGSRPMVLSEFGGYSCKIQDHYFGDRSDYGYRKCKDTGELLSDLADLYSEEIEPLKKKGLSAAIYTQLSDVEDETNGLLTYDRAVKKINIDPLEEAERRRLEEQLIEESDADAAMTEEDYPEVDADAAVTEEEHPESDADAAVTEEIHQEIDADAAEEAEMRQPDGPEAADSSEEGKEIDADPAE